MSANKPMLVTEDEKCTLQFISALVTQAAKEFHKLPTHLQDEITQYHNENTSLTHCLRWGEQSCNDLLDAIELTKISNKKNHPK